MHSQNMTTLNDLISSDATSSKSESESESQVGDDSDDLAITTPDVNDDDVTETAEEGDDEIVLTQREWRQKFIKSNTLYRRCKIRYSKFCYIKPRCAIPAKGKPVIYVAEGAENWTGSPNLLCAGQLICCDDQKWVILVVMWVGCLTRKKNNVIQYCPQSKGMKVLLCPQQVFDTAVGDLSANESELRYAD